MMKTRLILTVTFLGFAINVPALAPAGSSESQLTLEDLRTFTDVFDQLRTHYVEEIDDHTLLNAAINGMINELDPYSAFLDAEQSQVLENSAQGRYGGIGVSLVVRTGRLVVDGVVSGGPADLAGIRSGDLIIAVQGRPVRGRRLSESIEALKGAPGSALNLRVRTGQQESRPIQLQREFIEIPSVTGRLIDGDIGYFRISQFHVNTHDDMDKTFNRLQGALDASMAGIIIDLRNNSGGVLLPAVETADGFLEDGLIVYTNGRYPATRLEFRASPGQWAKGVPVVVLVNGNTASASEVLAAALQDNGRATVVGEHTFGKGSVQSVFLLRNGSTLKLTTAQYFTPSGGIIHENGVRPDILIDENSARPETGGDGEEAVIIAALAQLRGSAAAARESPQSD